MRRTIDNYKRIVLINIYGIRRRNEREELDPMRCGCGDLHNYEKYGW